MSDQTITLLILAISVVIFVWNRLPVGIVALGVALSLWATGILTIDQAVAGFGSPTVVLIAALFVVALVGVPLLIGTIAIVVLVGDRLLPDRGAKSFARDLSGLPRDLARQYI